MRKIVWVLLGFLGFFANAQHSEPNGLETLPIETQTLASIDSTAIFIDGKVYFPEKNRAYQLRDNSDGARIDSLWLQKIYQSNWYETMYHTITQTPSQETDTIFRDLPTDTLKVRLERLNQKTPFNIAYNPELERMIKSFLSWKKGYLESLMTAGMFYFPTFEQALDACKVPLEMKYLPIIESALNPRAKSRVGATGLWQFMYGTGKLYDLEVSSYVDERSDPLKSTRAASKHLADLYELFKDWDLALAAYNSGPGNVAKAIRRSGGYQNYWNLRPYLPVETAGYVPAFYAMLYIFEYGSAHGFKPQKPDIPHFETDTIHVKQLLTFEQLATVLNTDINLLRFFNPSYQLDIIPYIEGKKQTLRLPKSLIGKFITHEEAIYAYAKAELDKKEKPLPQLFEIDNKITYRVRSGDYLGRIAGKYGVTVNQLKNWNRLRKNNLSVGQKLIIYTKKPPAQTTSPSSSSSSSPSQSENETEKYYTVREGDTLWGIAQKFPGISIENIKEWNDISGTHLKPGTKLKVCSC